MPCENKQWCQTIFFMGRYVATRISKLANLLHSVAVLPVLSAYFGTIWTVDGGILVSDGDFSPANWSSLGGFYQAGTGQSMSQSQVGGNPDAYFEVTTIRDEITGTAHFRSDFVISLESQSISTIDFKIDIKEFATYGQGMAVECLLLQDGRYYRGGYRTTQGIGTQWTPRTVVGLTPDSFGEIDGVGQPDFDVGAPSITMGFFTSNSGGNGISIGFDNFEIRAETIPVPEPAEYAAVTGFAALAFGVCVQKKLLGK